MRICQFLLKLRCVHWKVESVHLFKSGDLIKFACDVRFSHFYSVVTPHNFIYFSTGTGYSSGGIATWNFANHHLLKIDNLKTLLATFETISKVDVWVIDTIYYILNNVISPTITLDEFFRNVEYYSIVISAVVALPNPSLHILPSVGLMRLYEDVEKSKIRSTLEPDELVIINKLEVIYQRFTARDAEAAAVAAALTASTDADIASATSVNTTTSPTFANKKRSIHDELGTSKSAPILVDITSENIISGTEGVRTTRSSTGSSVTTTAAAAAAMDVSASPAVAAAGGTEKDTENNGNAAVPTVRYV